MATPAVPEQKFVAESVGDVHDQVGEDEGRTGELHGSDPDAEVVDRGSGLPEPGPGCRGGQEGRAIARRDVEGVVNLPAWTRESWVETNPPVSGPGFGDRVVYSGVRVQVGGEPDPAPSRDAVLAQDADRQQRVVTAAALDTLCLAALVLQR